MDRVNPTHPDPITCLARIGEARSTRVEIWTQASTRVEFWWQERARHGSKLSKNVILHM